jgi:hypothetical protein
MELVRSSVPIASGLPREKVRSAPAIIVSVPAQRSLTLRPARSRSRLATLYIESSNSFVASAADRVERTSSRAGVSPAEVQCLSRRTVTQPVDSFRVADHSSSIVSGVINFEHLDELALGGYDCPHRLISWFIGS